MLFRSTAIASGVSQAVREQYEENPYPRWSRVALPDNPTNYGKSLRRQFPFAEFAPVFNGPIVDVLIAGCTTGLHSIGVASAFRNVRVLAIDISRASLAHAKRKSDELGLSNVEYAQADIMDIRSAGRTFDAIETSGVLHHLADPWAGWRVLLSLLRPGGLMNLAFYSEIARRPLIPAQSFIKEQGYGSAVEDIRRFRHHAPAFVGHLAGSLRELAGLVGVVCVLSHGHAQLVHAGRRLLQRAGLLLGAGGQVLVALGDLRSEEHTSELQSH